MIISGNRGPTPSFLIERSMGRGNSGIRTGSHLYRMFGSDFSQGNIGQPGYVPPSNRIPIQAASDLKRPTLGLRVCSGQCYNSIGH